MDIDYKAVISFNPLKKQITERGLKIKAVAQKVGLAPNTLSRMIKDDYMPKSDCIAKLAAYFKEPASQVVEFKGIKSTPQKKKWFELHALPYQPEGDVKGELSYEPLRAMTNMYLDYLYEETGKEKTANDLYDLIEPFRRRNGLVSEIGLEARRASLIARGYDADYKSPRTNRKYKAKGLTPDTRLKIKNDRPLNIRTVYDICNFFGCSIDWVMSYK